MDNIATAATKQQEHIFNDEMIAEILQSEKYMEEHPEEWVTSEQLFESLDKIINE